MSRALSRSGARRLHSFVSPASASCSPAFQRCGALPRWQAKQQSLDRNILVEVWPVNPDAWTNQLPTSSLAWSPFSQAGDQSIGTDTLRPSRNSTTSACSVTLTCLAAAASVARLEVAMPCLQQLGVGAPAPTPKSFSVRSGQSQGCTSAARAATRTWRSFGRAPHGCEAVRPGRSKKRRIDTGRSVEPSDSPLRFCQLSREPATLTGAGVVTTQIEATQPR